MCRSTHGPFHSFVCNVQRMASHVVGLIGRKQSGKDTFASRLVTAHGFTRLAFADALKGIALDVDPIIDVTPNYAGVFSRLSDALGTMHGWDGAKQLPAVRQLLQSLGVATREWIDPHVWVEALARQAHRVSGPVVVTDVRFINEVDWIKYAGGATVRIERPGIDRTDTHVSETELDGYRADHLVINDSSVASLHATADHFAARVMVAANL